MRLSLRRKIVGGFGLLLLLIALLGWVTLTLFGSLRDVQRRVFDEAIPGLVAVDEIVRSYTAQSAAIRGSLIGSEDVLLAEYREEVDGVDFWQERALGLFDEARDREILGRLIDAGEEFHDLVANDVIPLAEEGERSQAFRVLDQQGSPLISDIAFLGELLRSRQEDRVVGSEDRARSTTTRTLLILVVVVLAALAVGTLVALVLPRRLSRNLSRLVEAARAIGRGDLDHRVDIRSGDEVEELAERFGEMQAGLKRLQQLALQDRELEIAASIQRNLLQRSLPASPGVRVLPHQRQANLVGGDWYDVDVSSRELTVVVGDASGKGIGAALMATIALSFLRAERALGSNFKRIIERTNDALVDATDPGSFTTLIYATMDLRTGQARWLNMGHPAPFLLRPATGDGGTRGYYLEGPRNRALGWFDDPGFAETVAQIAPGDCLIFFTDGWLEAKSPEGETFGENRFAEAILRFAPMGAQLLAEQLVGEVERFAAGKLDDDLTMLVVEYAGSPEADDLPTEPAEASTMETQTGEASWHSRR